MPDLLMEKDGPVVVLTLNRPARRNAMTLAMFARLWISNSAALPGPWDFPRPQHCGIRAWWDRVDR